MVLQGKLNEVNNTFYLTKNFFHVGMSIVLIVFFTKLPYYLLEKYAKVLLLGTYILMFLVLLVGKEYNGARWWLDVPGLPSIQPVEFAKIGMVIFLSYFMKKKRSLLSSFVDGAVPYFSIVWVLFLLLALQPDFGSILIIAPVVVALYYVWGGSTRFLSLLLVVLIVGAGMVYSLGKVSNQSGLSYISSRIDSFFWSNESLFTQADTSGKVYQIKQWLIAIGSGGFTGLGFGKSIQKFGYLPEVQGDFVFSVFVEELWLLGAVVLIFLYLFIIYRGYSIARSVKDQFGKYVAFWLSTLILVQVFVNIGVNLNVIPLTGVTLPFVSYGGSSLIALMSAIGILLNISRYVELRPEHQWAHFMKRRKVY